MSTLRKYQYGNISVQKSIMLLVLFLLPLCATMDFSVSFLFMCLFIFFLLWISVVDIQTGLILNRVLLLFSFCWLLQQFFIPLHSIGSVLCAAVGSSSFLWFLRIISGGGMGCGDIKFVFVLGLWLGVNGIFLTLLLAFIFGGVAALVLLLFTPRQFCDKMPFGPFLSLGAYISFLYQPHFFRILEEGFL